MFERFGESARQVVVLAQDEARGLGHGWIGTEHILLGLVHAEGGVAARVLESFGVEVEEARARVADIVGRGDEADTGQIPFTPRAQRVLELALREELALGHHHIGSEHLLLGLVRENGGVAARILADRGVDPRDVADAVLAALAEPGPPGYAEGFPSAAPVDDLDAEIAMDSTTLPLQVPAVCSWRPLTLVSVVLTLLPFAIALGVGLLVGWLIWG